MKETHCSDKKILDKSDFDTLIELAVENAWLHDNRGAYDVVAQIVAFLESIGAGEYASLCVLKDYIAKGRPL